MNEENSQYDDFGDYSSDNENNQERVDNEIPKTNKAKRNNKWRFKIEFGTREQALKWIEDEDTWTCKKTYTT